jgi:hypothetical protein
MPFTRRLTALILCAGALPLLAATSAPDEGLRHALTRAMYSFEYSGRGIYRSQNPAQQLSLGFDSRDVQVTHPGGSIRFHLTGYGYGDPLQKPAPGTLSASGDRLEYQRGNLTEWYMNGSQGLEQGFTLSRRPGTPDRKGQPLVIAIAVSGELTPIQKANEESVQFQSSHGVVLRYAGLQAWDARGRTLTSHLEVQGRELRLIIDDRHARYPVTVDPTWTQQQELTPSGGVSGEQFGFSVAVSGDTAVIGAFEKNVGSNRSQGAAYVFVRSGGVWTEQQKLTASDGELLDEFGLSVAVSGNTAIIGSNALVDNGRPGAAYVFVQDNGVWTQQQKLLPSDSATGDAFGRSVAISGDTALIGAPDQEIGSHKSQGAAYVFVRSVGVWTQQQKITENGAALDYFGISVSVDGNTALIGAYGKSNLEVYQGAAYIFVRSGSVWTRQQELTASDGAHDDYFGSSVSLSGNTAFVGAFNKTIGSNPQQGAAYVFVGGYGVWTEEQEFTATNGRALDQFGNSVSVSGGIAVIGACQRNLQTHSGAAYVFVRSGGVWIARQQLSAPATGDFGISVAVDGNTTVIGNTEGYGFGSPGSAYVFVN